jgi:hypothetical protein
MPKLLASLSKRTSTLLTLTSKPVKPETWVLQPLRHKHHSISMSIFSYIGALTLKTQQRKIYFTF